MTAVQGQIVAGRWRLGERLGRGAAADVVDAVDERTGERAAVKVLRDDDPGLRGRFEREVQVLRSLHHPGIVGVLDDGVLDGRPFAVLERVDGRSLQAEVADRGALPVEQVVTIGAGLADALDHAHRRGVVHRDVKPANVLLDPDGRPHLVDFGVVQVDGASGLTTTGFTVGTAAYLAPEQLRGEPVGPPADVYALGLVLLELLTGERAFPGGDLPSAMARLERAPAVPAGLPASLAAGLRAMTAMDPEDRPAASTVATQFGALAAPPSDDTAVLPVAVVGPTVPTPIAPPAVTTPVASPGLPWWRNALTAALCFLGGFLLVLAVRLATDDDAASEDPVAPVVPSSATVATVAPATTLPPPSTAATSPPPEADDDEGEGRGNGRGRDRDRDD